MSVTAFNAYAALTVKNAISKGEKSGYVEYKILGDSPVFFSDYGFRRWAYDHDYDSYLGFTEKSASQRSTRRNELFHARQHTVFADGFIKLEPK